MKQVGLVISLFAAFAAPVHAWAQAADACVALLRHGMYDTLRNQTASASASVAQQNFCSSYNQYKRDIQSGSVQVSYAPFSGGASYSRDQMDQLGSAMCTNSYSSSQANASLSTFSSTIDPAAVNAYRECVSNTNQGLQASTQYDEDSGTGFSMTVYFVPQLAATPNVTFGGITKSQASGITCQGTLADLKSGSQFEVSHAYQLDCRRQIQSQPVLYQNRLIWAHPVTVTVGTTAGSIVRSLSALPAGPPPTPEIVPVGTIIAFSGTLADAEAQQQYGWWVADNRPVTDPAAVAFKGKKTPDLRNKFILGSTTSGQTGGSQKVTVPSQKIDAYTVAPGFEGAKFFGDPRTGLPDSGGGRTWEGVTPYHSRGIVKQQQVDITPPYFSVIYLVKVK